MRRKGIRVYTTTCCECGCLEQFKTEIKNGKRTKRFISGHNSRNRMLGKNNPMKNPQTAEKVSKTKTGMSCPWLLGNNNPMKRPEVAAKQGASISGNNNPMKRPEVVAKISGKNSLFWIDGSSFLPYSPQWNEQLKESIRERDNHICQMPGCGKTEKQNNQKLSVHHIDYNKENLNENNLISLCEECHIKTRFNRNYWEKFFQEIMLNA